MAWDSLTHQDQLYVVLMLDEMEHTEEPAKDIVRFWKWRTVASRELASREPPAETGSVSKETTDKEISTVPPSASPLSRRTNRTMNLGGSGVAIEESAARKLQSFYRASMTKSLAMLDPTELESSAPAGLVFTPTDTEESTSLISGKWKRRDQSLGQGVFQ